MAWCISFTDGTKFMGYDYQAIPDADIGGSMYFPKACLVIRSTNYTTPRFIKVDLDGHTWTWDGTHLNISGVRNIAVDVNEAVIMPPWGGNNSVHTVGAYSVNVWYSSTHEWIGVNSIAISPSTKTLSDFIQTYPNYYQCKNYYENGDIRVESYQGNNTSDYRYSYIWGGYAGTLTDVASNFPNSLTFVTTTDPYSQGGDSGTGGGTGNFDSTSDNVDIPSLPTLSASDAGFISIFNPTISQLNNLANYMWTSPLFDISNWKKLFADPMDAILGLSIVPVAVPGGTAKEVTVGNIGTGIYMTPATTQYVTVDCGSINVNEYWGGYLDYSPYTKAEIYLPYIGTRPIDIDDIMGKTVKVVYHVDIVSGACIAYVKCGGSVLYNYIGQCASSIPISGRDWTNVVNGILNIAGAVGSMAATGGASSPSAISSIASSASNVMKPNIEKSGALAGTGGMLGIQTPYLILTRPRQAVPANQNAFTGYPSYITRKLSSLSGYTEIETIHLENVSATEAETEEITRLLQSGVIL